MKTLFPFQELGRDFLALRANAILADDMGLGKTLQAIEAMKMLNIQRGVILCPLGVRRTWLKTLRDQHPTAFLKEITSPGIVPEQNAINIINYDIVWREPLIKELKQLRFPVLICDESHFLKSIDAKRTKYVLGKGGIYNGCQRRWMMTGTPVLNRPIELYPVLRSICPEKLGDFQDYYKYAYKFCAAYQDTFGFNTSGASNLKELANILAPFMLRRMKEEVLPDLPSITYEKIYLDPTAKIVSLSKQEKEDMAAAPSIRQAIGLLKVKPAIVHIEELLATKNKILVYTWHKAVYHALHDHFGKKSVLFTGEESIDAKEKAKEDFIKDPNIKVFIGQLDAVGVGTDGLQEVCDTCLFVELYDVPGKIKQACDRLRRIGQDQKVLAQFLVVEESVDEDIVNHLVDKSKNINVILKEGKEVCFVTTHCAVCRGQKEMKELKRVAGLSVCKDCRPKLECIA